MNSLFLFCGDIQFMDEVISEIRTIWPECRMVRGSPRRSSTNGGVERLNRTIETKLGSWMREKATNRWSVGCKLVQWRYNTQIHRTIGNKSPYHICFGQLARCGISNLPLSSELLDSLHTEDQLESLLHTNHIENIFTITADVSVEINEDDNC